MYKVKPEKHIILNSFRLMHKNTEDAKKHYRYMNLRLISNPIVNVYITKGQALDLIKELANMVALNDILYSEDD